MKEIHLPQEIADNIGIARSEARRLLATDRVKINGVVVNDLDIEGVDIYDVIVFIIVLGVVLASMLGAIFG